MVASCSLQSKARPCVRIKMYHGWCTMLNVAGGASAHFVVYSEMAALSERKNSRGSSKLAGKVSFRGGQG